MSTSTIFAYLGSLRASFIAAIQAFWFDASGEADRTAKLPPSGPMMLRAMSAMTLPMPAKSTCATKSDSPLADGIGESQVTTFVPAFWAAWAAGTIWSPALFESMTTLLPWVGALVMNSIWPWTLFSAVGPTNDSASGFWSSFAAS